MAGANQRSTFDKRVNTSEGHYVRWEVSVRDLHLMRSWHFVKNYRTLCGISPTSWDFKMFFPEVREDGTASLSVSLTRTDSLEIDMEASVWVDIGDPTENWIFPKQSFVRRGMRPGSKLQELVELEPYLGMEGSVNDPLTVLITLNVSHCHVSE